jgi:hypothetical protein
LDEVAITKNVPKWISYHHKVFQTIPHCLPIFLTQKTDFSVYIKMDFGWHMGPTCHWPCRPAPRSDWLLGTMPACIKLQVPIIGSVRNATTVVPGVMPPHHATSSPRQAPRAVPPRAVLLHRCRAKLPSTSPVVKCHEAANRGKSERHHFLLVDRRHRSQLSTIVFPSWSRRALPPTLKRGWVTLSRPFGYSRSRRLALGVGEALTMFPCAVHLRTDRCHRHYPAPWHHLASLPLRRSSAAERAGRTLREHPGQSKRKRS